MFLHKSVKLSKNVVFDNNVKNLITNCDILILAVPSYSTKEVLKKIMKYINKKIIIVNTAKALDYKTGKRLSEIVREELKDMKYNYSLLAGGTIANELFYHEPLGVDIACENKKVLPILIDLFQASNLSVYQTIDLKGVEYASAFKNVISILAGIIKGMNFSYGSETHIISRIAFEMEKIAVYKLGSKKKTFSMKSQCWGNDLWMSCTGYSRNREFGIILGKGTPVKNAIKTMIKKKKTVEGLSTIRALNMIVNTKKYPLLNFLYEFIVKESVGLSQITLLISEHKY